MQASSRAIKKLRDGWASGGLTPASIPEPTDAVTLRQRDALTRAASRDTMTVNQ
jgi:hypothetical protein